MRQTDDKEAPKERGASQQQFRAWGSAPAGRDTIEGPLLAEEVL